MKNIGIILLIISMIAPILIWDKAVQGIEVDSLQYTNYTMLLLVVMIVVNTGFSLVKLIK